MHARPRGSRVERWTPKEEIKRTFLEIRVQSVELLRKHNLATVQNRDEGVVIFKFVSTDLFTGARNNVSTSYCTSLSVH